MEPGFFNRVSFVRIIELSTVVSYQGSVPRAARVSQDGAIILF
jgi:hypothetical protein